MRIASLRSMALATSLLAMLAACSSEPKQPPKQEVGSLTQSLNMVDKDNKLYGHVEMTPIGGGKVYDASGQLIGKIVPARDKDDD